MPILDDEQTGVVFRADGLADAAPQTHALVVGVGHYGDGAEVASLTSSTKSARSVAGWLLKTREDGTVALDPPGGFVNSSHPLGTLAVVLSEGATDSAQFAGKKVPRATASGLKVAFSAWLKRARANRDNLAILYLCGHGLRDEKHTAFVLEDRDAGSTEDLLNGLIGLDQLADLMKRQHVRSQLLLFDCCRSDVALGLPDGYVIGTDLLTLAPPPGPDIEQMAMFATQPGMEARGRIGRTSLFAESLLAALSHAGASKITGEWTVSSMGLYRAMDSYLELFARAEHEFQRMAAASLDDFPLHRATVPSDVVNTYVHLADPSAWDDVAISVVPETGPPISLLKSPGQRFIFTSLKRDERVTLTANWSDGRIGKVTVEPDRPVLFAKIGAPDVVSVSVTPMQRSRGVVAGWAYAPSPPPLADGGDAGYVPMHGPVEAEDGAELVLKVTSHGNPISPTGVLTLKDHDGTASRVSLSDTANGLPLQSGRYSLELALTDGRTLQQAFELQEGKETEIVMERGGSPHEWLEDATAGGVLPIELRDPAVLDASPPLSFDVKLSAPIGFVGIAEDAPDFGARLRGDPLVHGSVARVDVEEFREKRFPRDPDGSNAHRPLWARCAVENNSFDVALPALGLSWAHSGWSPHIVAFFQSGNGGVAALASAGEAASVLAFLGRRDFANAAAAAEDLLESNAGADVRKCDNPIASAAVAIAMLAAKRTSKRLPPKWFGEFAQRFPSMPDASVIALRALWNEGTFEACSAAIRERAEQAYQAGVPIFGIALDWLVEGISLFDDDDAREKAANARMQARRSVRDRLFTTLKS